MRPMTTEMLKKGYLLFPKALFEEQMNMKTGEKAADAFEAFVFVLTHVNYSTVTCNVRGHLFDCVRGESVLSLAHFEQLAPIYAVTAQEIEDYIKFCLL